MANRLSSIEEIIEPEGSATGSSRAVNGPSDQVVPPAVRMGVGANGHAQTTIGADHVPVAEAGVGVDPPAEGTIDLLSIIEGDRLAGTVFRTFQTDAAKIDHWPSVKAGIRVEGHISSYNTQANAGS